ncbi:histidinol-phosphatase [Thalassovita aquimarina]|uniref:histidinol-phosphatase n=1 Tax=Thalassovita aquimarina TaxID=2785917 RepID=UPI00356849AF
MQRVKDTPDTETLTAFACGLADLAAPISLAYFRTPLDVERKADLSPVTQADRAVEAAMRQRIAEAFPSHGIFGEEHGNANLDSAHVWVLDPIDGTKSFVTGMPTFGTLIAYLEEGVPTVGVISIPPTAECWVGRAGEATQFGDKACRSSGCRRLSDASVYTTSPDSFDAQGLAAFEKVTAGAALRRFGGDCYSYGLLASGHVDAVIEMNLQPYDFLALVPVVEGAGGVITDWQGRPLGLGSDGRVVAAATAALHAEILAILKQG